MCELCRKAGLSESEARNPRIAGGRVWAQLSVLRRTRKRCTGLEDGRAADVVRGGDPCRQAGADRELPEPHPSGGLLREQLRPGDSCGIDVTGAGGGGEEGSPAHTLYRKRG